MIISGAYIEQKGKTMRNVFGFTMAEILLSLTIIGVVAAITLPSLTGNVNERVWNTQKKALYARFSQALALMPGLSGYGNYTGSNSDGSVSVTTDTAAEAFLTDGLSKVIKINNICDATHLADCGIPTAFTNLVGSTKTFPTKLSELNSAFITSGTQKDVDTKAAAFETQNGESIAVFYNPRCTANLELTAEHYVQSNMCANFIYDLNGNKGPNAVGKDIGFMSAIYASDPVIVAPVPLATRAKDKDGNPDTSYNLAVEACTLQDSESRLPNIEELSSMFYNNMLTGTLGDLWSSTSLPDGKVWVLKTNVGYNMPKAKGHITYMHCIKR